MSDETAMHDERRLRDLEAEAFRTGRTLVEHGQALTQIREQQRTAFSTIDSLADAVGAPGEQSIAQRLEGITQRLDGITQRLDGIERVLFALARN